MTLETMAADSIASWLSARCLITHCLRLNRQLHAIYLVRTCRISITFPPFASHFLLPMQCIPSRSSSPLLVTDILYCKLTSFLRLTPSYAFAIGNVRMYPRIGPKTRTNRRFSKTHPYARTKAKKEDVSGENRTYGNPISAVCASQFDRASSNTINSKNAMSAQVRSLNMTQMIS